MAGEKWRNAILVVGNKLESSLNVHSLEIPLESDGLAVQIALTINAYEKPSLRLSRL